MIAKDITHSIFYSPATNGRHETSLKHGEMLIKEYAELKCKELLKSVSVGFGTYSIDDRLTTNEKLVFKEMFEQIESFPLPNFD